MSTLCLAKIPEPVGYFTEVPDNLDDEGSEINYDVYPIQEH
jgi:hypothetical protein